MRVCCNLSGALDLKVTQGLPCMLILVQCVSVRSGCVVLQGNSLALVGPCVAIVFANDQNLVQASSLPEVSRITVSQRYEISGSYPWLELPSVQQKASSSPAKGE